mgnify:CR=1 FL=1
MVDSHSISTLKDKVRQVIEGHRDELLSLSHQIHEHPELGLEEHFASRLLCDYLEAHGFAVTRGAYGLETAFEATVGDASNARRRFVVCAEYDALPEVGHACGHNIIAAAAVGAALGAGALREEADFAVTVLGTPAEETIGGKALLVQRGALEGVDAAMMVHPAPVDVLMAPYLAVTDLRISVKGAARHASFQVGGSANPLDLLVDIHKKVRAEQKSEWERVAGIFTKGGTAPNVVPELVEAYYYLRAKNSDELKGLVSRVRQIAEETAEGSGCELVIESSGMFFDDVLHNVTLARCYEANAKALGRRFFPEERLTPAMAASTDMGNVSHVVAAIHPAIGIDSLPYLNHERGFAEAAGDERGDRAVLDGAIAMAWTITDLAVDDALAEAVATEFRDAAQSKFTASGGEAAGATPTSPGPSD